MRVAVVGASNVKSKFGNKAVRSYLAHKHEVFPIHPSETRIENLVAYPSVGAVQGFIDRVLLYVPGALGAKIVDELDPKRIGEVIVNPGAEHPDIDKSLRSRGIRVRHVCAIVDIGDSPARYP